MMSISFSAKCMAGEIRLVGGTVWHEGRVEVCVNDTWSTVCDDEWRDVDAAVACRNVLYIGSSATSE